MSMHAWCYFMSVPFWAVSAVRCIHTAVRYVVHDLAMVCQPVHFTYTDVKKVVVVTVMHKVQVSLVVQHRRHACA